MLPFLINKKKEFKMSTGALFGLVIFSVWFFIILNAIKTKKTNNDKTTSNEIFTTNRYTDDIVDMQIKGIID
jgi:hypothetical protein